MHTRPTPPPAAVPFTAAITGAFMRVKQLIAAWMLVVSSFR
jgi:hypothetical protein